MSRFPQHDSSIPQAQFVEPNPYAAPLAASYAPVTGVGIWRDGKMLVMHRAAQLPNVCVKSNEPARRKLKRKLSWHAPWVFLFLLFNLFIYAIVAVAVSKRATVHVGLTDDWFSRRRRRVAIAWLGSLMALVACGFGIASIDGPNEGTAGLLLILGPLAFVTFLIYGLIATRIVTVQRIRDDYIWLSGVNLEYLNRFPLWPGPR